MPVYDRPDRARARALATSLVPVAGAAQQPVAQAKAQGPAVEEFALLDENDLPLRKGDGELMMVQVVEWKRRRTLALVRHVGAEAGSEFHAIARHLATPERAEAIEEAAAPGLAIAAEKVRARSMPEPEPQDAPDAAPEPEPPADG